MKNRNRAYSNGEITIYWRASECVHNTHCYRTLRAVFDPSKRPWINPLAATTDEIIEVIAGCPTDALMFKWNDENKNAIDTSDKIFRGNFEQEFLADNNSTNTPTEINIRPNGPIVISGNFQVIEHDGKPLKPTQMTSLCRCGHSRNMPYCDGMHFKFGFSDK